MLHELDIVDSHVHLDTTQQRVDSLDSSHSFSKYLDVSPSRTAVFIGGDITTTPRETYHSEDYSAIWEEIRNAASLSFADPGRGKIGAIIAFAPVHLGPLHLLPFLEDLKSVDTSDLVRGFRYILENKPDGTCLLPPFIASLSILGEKGYLFEVTIDIANRGMRQLEEIFEMSTRCASTLLVLDHAGTPNLRTLDDPWYTQIMVTLASMPCVYVKLSSMPCPDQVACQERGTAHGREAEHGDPDAGLQKMVRILLASFGAPKMIWASNYPSPEPGSGDANDPGEWCRRCKDILTRVGVDGNALNAVFKTNAVSVYGIGKRPGTSLVTHFDWMKRVHRAD